MPSFPLGKAGGWLFPLEAFTPTIYPATCQEPRQFPSRLLFGGESNSSLSFEKQGGLPQKSQDNQPECGQECVFLWSVRASIRGLIIRKISLDYGAGVVNYSSYLPLLLP